jgi:LuxR family transcriptional regulator, maltose regulon positive regulatory protein
VPDELPTYLVWLFALVQVEWALLRADMHELRRQAELMSDDGWPDGHALVTALLADLTGDHRAAGRQLDAIVAAPPQHQAIVTTAIASVHRVRMLLRDGHPRLVRGALHDMLERVVPQRLLGTLVFTGPDPALHERLRQEAASPRRHRYAQDALDALDRHARYLADTALPARPGGLVARGSSSAVGVGDGPTALAAGQARTLALTDREADVLRELALGGSYLDVARALYVTENTVKTHVASLYRKLGVDRRADALRQARLAGLL